MLQAEKRSQKWVADHVALLAMLAAAVIGLAIRFSLIPFLSAAVTVCLQTAALFLVTRELYLSVIHQK